MPIAFITDQPAVHGVLSLVDADMFALKAIKAAD